MTKRAVRARYQGSVLGLGWTLALPLFMAAVYTFVFTVVFEARWGQSVDNELSFAVILFSGLIVFNFFSECISSAPTLILSNTSLVKKVIFPLEMLTWVSLLSAAFIFLMSFLVLIGFQLIAGFTVPLTVLSIPGILLPLVLLTAGLTWFLSSLGVYLRDLGQVISVIISMLLFLSPIFYPLEAVPESFRGVLMLNPLTIVIEQFRDALLFGAWPDLTMLGLSTLASFLFALLGYIWFQKTKKGFADVL